MLLLSMDVRFWPEILALKSDLKKSRICPIWGQSDPLWSQTYHPWFVCIKATCNAVIFWPMAGLIGPIYDKSGTFIRYDFSTFWLGKTVLKSGLKKFWICPIWVQSGPPWAKICHPCKLDTVVSVVWSCLSVWHSLFINQLWLKSSQWYPIWLQIGSD